MTTCLALCIGEASRAQLPSAAPPERMQSRGGNFIGETDRPLRYFPDGTDFVITNGTGFFNRPLYGGNSAFRVDGGDKPEFSLYLPGRGGNLRFGIQTADATKWLHDADQIVARYRPGSLHYHITDACLRGGRLELSVVGLYDRDGLIARAELEGTDVPVTLFWAFGGANGMRGRRGGDIGCEREPVSTFFQLHPEQCAGDKIDVAENTFVLTGPKASIRGVATVGSGLGIASARNWTSAEDALNSAGPGTPELPIVVGHKVFRQEHAFFLALQPQATESERLRAPELEDAFSVADAQRDRIASRVVVQTPDPFLNAAAAALNIAADAVWDETRTSFMHGAVAWRNRLLGWRGMYAGDALGWHDRTRLHLAGYASEQNTDPIPERIPKPEASANLSRNETALHSNGNMTRKHYDMNLVAVDAFFRHLLWTGDLDFARDYWPVLERHLAWERRLFRRGFGQDQLPLYEGYACFWASDDVAYNGGGSAIGSAYNQYHNKMAARLAMLLGEDPGPYEREAELIARAMRRELWLPDQGWFAEYKDWLGLQRVHPSPGLWSIYRTIDSEVPTPEEAWQMTRFVNEVTPHIPLAGPNVPSGCFTIPTSNWMPYNWSVNNVVMAEVTHTALACWQAGRPDLGLSLFKGALLDSMFMGLCPGNVGMCTSFDAYRHECQRDFADGAGATARALVEGLFGIRPDALTGSLTIQPGFPLDWDHASIRHPDLDFDFRRDNTGETFVLNQRFREPMKLKLRLTTGGSEPKSVTVNGIPSTIKWIRDLRQSPQIEIEADPQTTVEVVITWDRNRSTSVGEWQDKPSAVPSSPVLPGPVTYTDHEATHEPIDLRPVFNDRVTQIFRNEYLAPRSPFCSLATPKQGIGSWCLPDTTFDVDDSGLRALAREGRGVFRLPNGIPFATPAAPEISNIAFVSQWDNHPTELSIPVSGRASRAYLLMAGSTGPMQSRIDNGEIVFTYSDGTFDRLPLHNPTTWWPIDQDYFIDDYAFRLDGPLPTRVDLKTGAVRVLERDTFKGRGGGIPGGAATVLEVPLNPDKELRSLTLRALANEVVLGLMSVTLAR